VFSAASTAAADTTSGQTVGATTTSDSSGDDSDDGVCAAGPSVSTDTASAGDDEASESGDTDDGACGGLAITKTGDARSTVGATENFTYKVTNTGTRPVAVDTATGVTDDKCSPVVYDGGDTANTGFVDSGETWTFHCAYVVSHDAENQAHDIVNTATVKGTITVPAETCSGTGESSETGEGSSSSDSVSTDTTSAGDDESSEAGDESGCAAESGSDETSETGDDDSGSTPKTINVSATATWTTHIVHPALSVTKAATEAAGVNEGDTIHYTITVTNVGDTMMNVTATDVGCTGLTPVGFSLSPAGDFPLAPTESKQLKCIHVATANDGSAYVNEACATGVATPAATGGTVKKCGSVSVNVTHPTPGGNPPPAGPTPGGPSAPSTSAGTNDPGGQLVLGTRITPGSARLLGPSGCATSAFNARVRGTKIARVVFVLDGKTLTRLAKPNLGTLYSVRINPSKLRLGVHRLVVSVTFQRGSGTKPKTLRLSFQRCGRALADPRFTG
jgi:uncharacterized repeat protein (TIGR01451 family)